jgi:ferredoxin
MRLRAEFLAGLSYGGPALFNVYVGSTHSRLPRYLDAAAACESRAFPSFRFDPGRGATQAERMDVQANSLPDRRHATERFSYQTGSAQEAAAELAFTTADFLLCDRRRGRDFWAVRPGKWHADMLPLQDWLALDAAQAAEKIPYLTAVGANGEIGRVVPSRRILAATLEVDGRWRSLQEAGGIHNSFALRALAEERQRLEEEKARQVAAIEQEYADKLEQSIGALTEEIVARIAAQLTGDGAALAAMPLAQPVARAPAAAPPAADEPAQQADAAEAAEEIDEEPLTFDDPYIDTPLCTSCNECTDMNSQLFGYDENKQAHIKDLSAGTFRELVLAAEVCPVRIIHPGKPKNADEENLEEWVKRAEPFN